jgi:anaerobic magnesium-protoporphyrin IX monomethyl ester cyclase
MEIKRILFINAINPYSEVENRYPALGLAYLASALKGHFGRNEFEFKIISNDVENVLNSFKPHFVGISSVSQNYNYAVKYASLAKRNGAIVGMGGIHITNVPNSASRDMDFIILGEGEKTLCELIDALQKGEQCYRNIKGIGFWEKDNLNLTEKRPLMESLDDLPFPERNLISVGKHTYIFTSRGCPYRCVFCSSSRYWDQVRFFSPEYVVSEIIELVNKYDVELISIYDDLFLARLDRVEKIVDELEKRGILGKVSFTCSCRANLVSEKAIRLLKRLGVRSVSMGLESGNEEILSYLKCGSVFVKDNFNAISLLKKYKIKAIASFVIGSPEETLEQLEDTYNFIKTSKLDLFDTYVLTPLPGTPVWNEALNRGLVSENMDWSKLNVNFHANPEEAIILSKKLSHQEMIKVYKKFSRLRMARNIKGIFGHPYFRDIPAFALRKVKEYMLSKYHRNR